MVIVRYIAIDKDEFYLGIYNKRRGLKVEKLYLTATRKRTHDITKAKLFLNRAACLKTCARYYGDVKPVRVTLKVVDIKEE